MSIQKRTNEEWVDGLSGTLGQTAQTDAIHDLVSYLFGIVRHYLHNRQNTLFKLRFCSEQEINDIAEEIVQRFMEKLVKDRFALLKKYSGKGRFTGWAVKVTINLCRDELRRKSWHTTRPIECLDPVVDHQSKPPDMIAVQTELRKQIIFCLDQLPDRYRIALVGIVVEGISTAEVGAILGISANAASILAHRGKKRMREKFEEVGIGADALAAFV